MSTSPEETKRRILLAAGELFADRGFEQTTVRDITRKAKTNIGSVNYHFGGKEPLYIETLLHANRCGLHHVKIDESLELGDQLRLYIREFTCKVLTIRSQSDWTQRLLLRELVQPSPATDVLVKSSIRPGFEILTGILQRICPKADHRRLHSLAFSVVGQCLYYRLSPHIGARLMGQEAFLALDLEVLTEHITGFTLAALGMGPPIDETGRPASSVGVAREVGR